MIERPSLKEKKQRGKKLKRQIFRLEKENKGIKDRIIRDIMNLFRLEKEHKAIKYRILLGIGNLFEYEEENY